MDAKRNNRLQVKAILKRYRNASKTGEWWKPPWWLKFRDSCCTTKKRVEDAFKELINTFDAKWFLDQKNNNFSHGLAKLLLMEGAYPFQILCSLGRDLYTLHKASLPKKRKDLVRRIKNPNEHWESAVFELRLISHFLSHGFNIEPDYRTGKGKRGKATCDLKVSKADEVYFIEIKRPREIHGRNKEIYKKNVNEANHTLKNGKSGVFVGNSFSIKTELKAIFKLVYHAVRHQLPSHGASCVVVESIWGWPFDNFEAFKKMAMRRFTGRYKHTYRNLCFIAIIKNSFDREKLELQHQLKIVKNSNTNMAAPCSNLIRIFTKLFPRPRFSFPLKT